jgi:hypothetical protein
MALTGTLTANFDSFNNAVDNAVIQLRGFEASTNKVEASLTKMTDQFSGRLIITEATLMAKAVENVGGVAKLTAEELARVSATASEAAAKLKAMGQEVPANIQTLADAVTNVGGAAEGTATHVGTLHSAMNQFDGMLGALGIHIGPEVRGLSELGDASGKSASEIGLLGVAGLAFGAAVGGWKIGRAVADFFDLDTTIGNATAKLLGWGDVAAQVAGSQADVLARASARVGFEVHSLTDAMAINAQSMVPWQSNMEISAAAVAKWHAEIATVRTAGDLPSLTADLQSQNFSLQELSRRYGISVEALQVFTRETHAASEAEKAAAAVTEAANRRKLKEMGEEIAAHKELQKAQEEADRLEAKQIDDSNVRWAQTAALKMQLSGTTTEKLTANLNVWVEEEIKAHKRAHTDTADFYTWLDQQAALRAQVDEQHRLLGDTRTRESFAKRKEAAEDWYRFVMEHTASFTNADIEQAAQRMDASTKEWVHWGEVSGKALDATIAKEQKLAEAAAAANRAMGGSFTYDLTSREGVEQYRAMNTGETISWSDEQIMAFAAKGGTLEQLMQMGVIHMRAFAQGGPVLEDGPIYAHAGEYVMPRNSGAAAMVNNFYLVDNTETLARKVSDLITRQMLRGGARLGTV